MRLLISFFLLGLINNVLYVIILSAALDLVGSAPKATVLLANILPGVCVKLIAPYAFRYTSYRLRVALVVTLNFIGMLLVPNITMLGISMASAASGTGEITFLHISHSYPPSSLAAWSSGTGAAGVVGGLLYTTCTTVLRISPRVTLLSCALLPIIMAIAYNLLPPREIKYMPLEQPKGSVYGLIVPYMLPLFIVYFAEYTINQGVAPTLMFPIEQTPFSQYRDIYPTYATLYQIGVFISRSSSSFIRLRTPKKLYSVSFMQCGVLLFMLAQAFLYFSNIYVLFLIILVEGLFGGLVYVNAFHNCSESTSIPEEDKEFSIGTIGLADSLGILTAALFSLWLEPFSCHFQSLHGRPWCQ